MAVLFGMKVWDQAISGAAATTVYTDPTYYRTIAQAEKFNVSARVTQVGGVTPTITIVLEHSNDGVNWLTKHTFILTGTPTGATLNPNAVNLKDGSDLGTAVVGAAQMRLAITLGGTGNPTAYVEVWLCGRSND